MKALVCRRRPRRWRSRFRESLAAYQFLQLGTVGLRSRERRCTTLRMRQDTWDPNRYDIQHAFVHQLGAGVVELLAPQPGERVLDVGCGTGHLTRKIADAGAEAVGVDASAAMVAEARRNFPELRFEVADATTMRFDEPFDAIFSNAALHWVKPPEAAIERMAAAMKPGGRLVVEFGGKGNVKGVLDAASAAGREVGVNIDHANYFNYFPSISQYATLLEQRGFEVNFAVLFDRPTALNDGEAGLRNWIRMFRPEALKLIPPADQERFFTATERIARPALFREETWHADYRRLRVRARRQLAA